MAIDLTFARRIATALMTPADGEVGDTCIITYDPGVANDEFDYATGQVVRGALVTIYEGVCLIASRARPTGTRAGVIDYEGGAPAVIQLPEVRIPFDAPDVPVGANVTILTSVDATAVGDRYVVRDVNYGSLAPWRVLSCNRWVEGQTIDHG